MLNELSPPLRTELLMYLNKDMVTHIPFFSDQPPAFVVSVCSLLKPWCAAFTPSFNEHAHTHRSHAWRCTRVLAVSHPHPRSLSSSCSFALAYDYIFREGDVAYEMYFLQRGVIQLRCVTGHLAEASSANSAGGEGAEHTSQVSRHETVLDEQEAVSYFGEVPLLIASAELQGESGKGGGAFDKLAAHTLPDITKAFATFDIDGTGTPSPSSSCGFATTSRQCLNGSLWVLIPSPPAPPRRHALARRAEGDPHQAGGRQAGALHAGGRRPPRRALRRRRRRRASMVKAAVLARP